MRPCRTVLSLFALSLGVGEAQTPAQLELFEKSVRPLFAEKCEGCHNARLKSGGLDFSSANAVKEDAALGIFGSAAQPDESILIKALSYESRIKMPPQGKLPAETIAAVREWVAAGAPTPAATAIRRGFAGRNRRSAGRAAWGHHRRRQEVLVFQAHLASSAAYPQTEGLGRQSHRPVHPRQPRKERAQTRAAGR